MERGVVYAVVESVHMFCSGMLLFFAFVTRTRAYALDKSVLTGAATYKVCGRPCKSRTNCIASEGTGSVQQQWGSLFFLLLLLLLL